MISGKVCDSPEALYNCYRRQKPEHLQRAGLGIILDIPPEEFDQGLANWFQEKLDMGENGHLVGLDVED